MTDANGWTVLPLDIDAASTVVAHHITGDTTMTTTTTAPIIAATLPSCDPVMQLTPLPTNDYQQHIWRQSINDTLMGVSIGGGTHVAMKRAQLTITLTVEVPEMNDTNTAPDALAHQTAVLLARAATVFNGIDMMTRATSGEIMAVLHSIAINPMHVQPAPEPEPEPEPTLTRYMVRVEAGLPVERTITQQTTCDVARTFVVLARNEDHAGRLAQMQMRTIIDNDAEGLLEDADTSDIDWDDSQRSADGDIEVISGYVARRFTHGPSAEEVNEIDARKVTEMMDEESVEVIVQDVTAEDRPVIETDDESLEMIIANYRAKE